MSKQASQLFMDLICDGGIPSIDCQLCGRTHFATGPMSCEDERDIEKYRALAVKQPDKFCESSDDSISFGYIDGQQVVWDCPCHKLWRYETFIWEHRQLIVDYIKARTANDLKEAQKMADSLSAVITP